MGFTLTDVLLFGSAIDNIDSDALVILRSQILQFGATNRAIEVVVSGIPPLSLVGAVADSLTSLKAFGGTALNTIPSEYTQLDYITATGTQCIETDLSGVARWVGAGQGTSQSAGSKVIVSAYATQLGVSKGAVIWLGSRLGSADTGKYWTLGGASSSGLSISTVNTLDYAEYDVTFGDDKFTGTINNTSFTDVPNTWDIGFWRIGASFTQGATTANYYFVGNIYRQKAYQNNVLVGDFIPVKRKSDNVVGMYDAVSGKFYTNAGTGSFTAGNEVVPTPSDPMDIYCNNGKISILDHTNWNVITNPTSQSGKGMFINTEGKLQKANDRGAGVFIPVTVGKKYTVLINRKTVDIGTIIRYGQSNNSEPPSSSEQLLDWYRGTLTDGMMISFTAKRPYFVMQLSANLVEATGGIDNTIEVIEAAGDNETIAITTRNLNNDATNVDGYYIGADGSTTASANSCYSAIIPVVAGQTYTWSGICGGSSFNNKRVHGYIDGVWNQQIAYEQVTAQAPFAITFTVPAGINGIRISHFNEDTNTQVEVGSTKTAYVAYNGSTATANNLFKLNNYQDIQEIITGATTHNCGVLVLDGTENWGIQSGTYQYFRVDFDKDFSLSTYANGAVCSHFEIVSLSASTNNQGTGLWKYTNTGKTSMGLRYDNLYPATSANIANLKSWLAAQYAAGTPVIVVYPLATPYTEVAPIAQSMTVVDGDNTVSLTQQGMTPLTLEATYTAGVSVTITEIENANIGNDVDVVIA